MQQNLLKNFKDDHFYSKPNTKYFQDNIDIIGKTAYNLRNKLNDFYAKVMMR